jgi:HPt (histidine-containing phosphotransfer) domain-containing protein
MSGYLTKPFKAHELFATVEGWAAPEPSAPTQQAPAPSAPVDLDAFRQEMRAAGAEEAVDPVLDTYLQSAPDRIAAVTTALASGAGPEIERAAHAFKSASATIGAKGLAALLQQLEVAGKAGDVTAARQVGDGLVRESEAVMAYLRQVRGAATPTV